MASFAINDFAGFRGNRARTGQIGRLAVPPTSAQDNAPACTKAEVAAPSLSAADKVRQRLLALKSGNSTQVGARTPGIASGTPKSIGKVSASTSASLGGEPVASRAETSGGEVLLFTCTGQGCSHMWVSGRGSTSFEQICKCCGASVVGVLTKGGVQCEVSKEGKDDIGGEIIRIEFQRPLGPGYPAHELEIRLHDFVESEIRFISKFFNEEGIEDYVAYRRGGGKEEEQDRDMKKDVVLVNLMACIVQGLCKAEFQGIMRGGEADSKLQGLLNGQICFRFVSPPDRSKLGAGGSTINLAVDFAIARDVPDRVADAVDERLQKLRGVMKEMDKNLLAKVSKEKLAQEDAHPRKMLAGLISALDWQKALAKISGREGHDQVRCMTCRFIGEDCSCDVQRSQDVRRMLLDTPGFIFQTKMVLTREDRGGKSWQDRVSSLLAGIAGTRGGECFILASSDAKDRLQLSLYSHPEWLASAVQRITTYSQGGSGSSSTPFFTDLLGLGRCAKGLQVIEPSLGSPPKFEVVSDVLSFIDLFACAASADGVSKRVRWHGSAPRCLQTQSRDFERARKLFRLYASFDEMTDFFDFLQDFRHKGAARAKPEPRPPRPVDKSETLSQTRSSSCLSSRAPSSPSQAPAKKRKRCESTQTRRSPSYRRSSSSSPSAPQPRARRSPSYRRER